MRTDEPVLVAGGASMVGSAIVRALRARGFPHVISGQGNADEVLQQMASVPPAWVFIASGRARGISANIAQPATVMLDNLLFEVPIIRAAHQSRVRKLLYLGSSCCYPRDCPQPMQPASIWTSAPEPTNLAYSSAKLAALTLCQAYRQETSAAFISAIPATPYGIGDEYDPTNSHVAGALIHRFHQACQSGSPQVDLWGSGEPIRDFIFADDLADACLFLMEHYDGAEPVNVAAPPHTSIRELATTIAEVAGYQGRLRFDTSRPDGALRKVLDGSVIAGLGWRPATSLRRGLELTYQDYLANGSTPESAAHRSPT